MTDLQHDALVISQIDFFLAYILLVVVPVLAKTNWLCFWRELTADCRLFYWCKIYPRFIRGNLSDGRDI